MKKKYIQYKSRVLCGGKTGERLFIHSSRPVPPDIRNPGAKVRLGPLPFSQDIAAGPCRKSESRGLLDTT